MCITVCLVPGIVPPGKKKLILTRKAPKLQGCLARNSLQMMSELAPTNPKPLNPKR